MTADTLRTDIESLAAQLCQLKQGARERGTAAQRRRPLVVEQVIDHSWINPHVPIAWPRWPAGVWPKVVAVCQKVVRRLLKWYIDPIVEQQNAFNVAVVRAVDDLYEQNRFLRRQLESVQHLPVRGAMPEVAADLPICFDRQRPLQRRLRLAFFTPLSPTKTAIADHSEGLLPAMAAYADVDLYTDGTYTPTNPAIVERFNVYGYREFPARVGSYDAVLYAMGDNAAFHAYIYETLQRFPGIVVLHDTTLHRFIIGTTLHKGEPRRYLDEMEYAYGLRDLRVPEQLLAGYGEALIIRYPFIERVLDSAQGVIVHNAHACREVLGRRPEARVACIGQHFFLPPGFPSQVDRSALRAELGLTNRFVIATFGILVSDKRLDTCLGAFARFAKQHPEATYLFVGSCLDYDLPGKVHSLGLDDRVVVTNWLDPVRFTQMMFAADVGVHLRYPHIGGTPFSPIRMMGLGIPTIVSDIEPLAEFPEGCCIKIAPDEYEEDTLLACFELLAGQPDVRKQLSENGRRFLATYHNASDIARQYLAFVEQTVEVGVGP